MNVLRHSLVGVVVTGLAVDAYVHSSLASTHDPVRAIVSQSQHFRVETAAAVVAALLLLLRPGRLTAAIAALVAGGGLGPLLVLRYVDVASLGPFLNKFEPLWYAQNTWTPVAQAVATAAAVALVVLGTRPSTPPGHARSQTDGLALHGGPAHH